jgi:hypothetical protein
MECKFLTHEYAKNKSEILNDHKALESATIEPPPFSRIKPNAVGGEAKESMKIRNTACDWFGVAEHTSFAPRFIVSHMLFQAVGLPNMSNFHRG